MADHPGAGPFTLGEQGATRVLLLHGLTGAPSELWPLGLALSSVGHHVYAPVWPGHGTAPEDLLPVTADALVRKARALTDEFRPDVVVGLSMGALLATITASERPPRALVLLAIAEQMAGSSRVFSALGRVPWPTRLKRMLRKGGPAPFRRPHAENASQVEGAALAAPEAESWDGRYDAIPLRWSRELVLLQRLARKAAERVACPTLFVHGLEDQTAAATSSIRMARRMKRIRAQIRLIPGAPHVLTLAPERGLVAAEIHAFLEHVLKNQAPDSP